MPINDEKIAEYIFEAGMLKRIVRSGWWTEKVENPESVAEHVFRAAVIGFVLAKMEGLENESANRVCTAVVFHDMHETRLLDLNKITARYVKSMKKIGQEIEKDQVDGIDTKMKQALLDTLKLSPKEEEILNDADCLECAFQAKEYADIGYDTLSWLDNLEKRIKTKSAIKLLGAVRKMNSGSWKISRHQ